MHSDSQIPLVSIKHYFLQERVSPLRMLLGFADADKRMNWDYYELMMQLVRPGGLILIDNVLFYGRVADPLVSSPPFPLFHGAPNFHQNHIPHICASTVPNLCIYHKVMYI